MTGEHHRSVSLSEAALRSLNETVLELNDPAKSGEEVFDDLVTGCRTLIPHSSCFVVSIDRHSCAPVMFHGPWAELATELAPGLRLHFGEHPYALRHCLTSVPAVDAVSGHMSQRQWRSTGLFEEVYKGAEAEDQITSSEPFDENLTISLVVNRDGWGFRQEEQAVLSLLLPHAVQAWRTRALIRRQEAAVAAAGAVGSSGDADFQVVADSQGYVIDCSDESGLRQFWERFRETGRTSAAQLPGPVRRWFRDALAEHFSGGESTLLAPLSHDLRTPEGGRFHLRLLPDSLRGLHVLAIERRDPPQATGAEKLEVLGLSPRRAEVLYWVAQGKSNEEIAAILGISIHTANNHMKAIYGHLQVENRNAAALMAWKVLGGTGN